MPNRQPFAQRIRDGETTSAPVCLDPLTGRLIESLGFPAAYLSGGVGFGGALRTTRAIREAAVIARTHAQLAESGAISLPDGESIG